MEGTTGIQPTYNLADRGYSDSFGFGGGSGIWLFAILALMWEVMECLVLVVKHLKIMLDKAM